MKTSIKQLCLILLLTVFISTTASAVEIFVWQHDNNLAVADPVIGGNLTATQAVTRTLDAEDIDYTLNRQLPDNLAEYDVVITCLSFYCPG
ncbi:MAG: hypothetical protein HN356_07830 [Calditrichaeota bacterium]|nr:hypothetical protein [Calditrichota bacterium]MBT7617308.1 hypothetical protein [Calditrichota bacterium]MBT7789848.1 hypothetical protein [Calditrichota bacterium]